jgi:hypothetical protein
MSEPMYLPVKNKGDYKITAIETTYKTHKGTNTVVEKVTNTVLDEVLYQGFYSKEMAVFAAMKDMEKSGKVEMDDVRVKGEEASNPF